MRCLGRVKSASTEKREPATEDGRRALSRLLAAQDLRPSEESNDERGNENRAEAVLVS